MDCLGHGAGRPWGLEGYGVVARRCSVSLGVDEYLLKSMITHNLVKSYQSLLSNFEERIFCKVT